MAKRNLKALFSEWEWDSGGAVQDAADNSKVLSEIFRALNANGAVAVLEYLEDDGCLEISAADGKCTVSFYCHFGGDEFIDLAEVPLEDALMKMIVDVGIDEKEAGELDRILTQALAAIRSRVAG